MAIFWVKNTRLRRARGQLIIDLNESILLMDVAKIDVTPLALPAYMTFFDIEAGLTNTLQNKIYLVFTISCLLNSILLTLI